MSSHHHCADVLDYCVKSPFTKSVKLKKKNSQKRFPKYHVRKSGTDWLPALKTEPRGRCYSWNRGIKIVMELLTTQSVANLEWKGHKRYRQYFFFSTVVSFQSVSWCFEQHKQRSGVAEISAAKISKTRRLRTCPHVHYRFLGHKIQRWWKTPHYCLCVYRKLEFFMPMFYAHRLYHFMLKAWKISVLKKSSRTFRQALTQEKC